MLFGGMLIVAFQAVAGKYMGYDKTSWCSKMLRPTEHAGVICFKSYLI